MECIASEHLTWEDWGIVSFYRRVADQVDNQTPFGLEKGGTLLVPRLEAWEAACRVWGVPKMEREHLISQARYLHDCVEERIPAHEVLRLKDWELAPLDEGRLDGAL